MRPLLFTFSIIIAFIMFTLTVPAAASETRDEQALILEVSGNPDEHAEYITTYHPFIEVVETYDVLFMGLAVKGPIDKIKRLGSLDFIKTIHPVTTYTHPQGHLVPEDLEPEIPHSKTDQKDYPISPQVVPRDLNTTPFTGKGIKVGVIDTGIDFNHPDLKKNYKGGYDLVDLDQEPMETKATEGLPTLHGTHVSGIIAADGELKGVAPDVDLYAYRALGPGGQGTSVQVIAALEKAVQDGMDVINLSLGNAVNGPDYPTSQAVNKATEQGAVIVIANGNDGPDDWTIGSPATAVKALSVGATAPPARRPVLFELVSDEEIEMRLMMGSLPWTFQKDYPVEVMTDKTHDLSGSIALVKRGKTPFYEMAEQAETLNAEGLLIMNKEAGLFQGSIASGVPVTIPVAAISQASGQTLKTAISEQDHTYLDTRYVSFEERMAAFSSRGPVTVSWDIKPEIIAPGANILSTVPNGYKQLQGTSMAAPHVAGAVAALKEARPGWSSEQLKGALTTTAHPLTDESGELVDPTTQGAGNIQLDRAVKTDTIIRDSFLTYGKIDTYHQTEILNLTLDNTGTVKQTYRFDIPQKKQGITWNLPQTFSINPGESKTISVGLSVTSMLLEEGLHQGWLTLNQDENIFHLPYLFVNQTADYPKVMGIGIAPKAFSDQQYTYQFYMPDDVDQVTIDLYDAQTLIYDRTLLDKAEVTSGMNKGELSKQDVGSPGTFKGIMTMELADGTIETQEVEVIIPPIEEH